MLVAFFVPAAILVLAANLLLAAILVLAANLVLVAIFGVRCCFMHQVINTHLPLYGH